MTSSEDGGICAATLPNNPIGTMWVTTFGGGPATFAKVSFTVRAGMYFGIAFTTASVTADGAANGGISETTVAGAFTDAVFVESGALDPYELPIQADENNGYFSALLTLSCGGNTS